MSDASLVELINPFTQVRLAMSREAVLRLLAAELGRQPGPSADAIAYLTEAGLLEATETGGMVAQAQRLGPAVWRERNWQHSLNFLLWSRRWEFFDNGPNFEEQRDEAVAEFLAHETAPPERVARQDVQLPIPELLPDVPLGLVLKYRRSVTAPPRRPTTVARLSSLLWHGFAPWRYPRHREYSVTDFEYYVDIGRLYDIYVFAFDVTGLANGIYYYSLNSDGLEEVALGDFRAETRRMLIGQPAPETAAATITLALNYRRVQWVYRHDRVFRNAFIHSGKLLQDLILVATAYSMETSITPAVSDREATEILGLDPTCEQVVHTVSVS